MKERLFKFKNNKHSVIMVLDCMEHLECYTPVTNEKVLVTYCYLHNKDYPALKYTADINLLEEVTEGVKA